MVNIFDDIFNENDQMNAVNGIDSFGYVHIEYLIKHLTFNIYKLWNQLIFIGKSRSVCFVPDIGSGVWIVIEREKATFWCEIRILQGIKS